MLLKDIGRTPAIGTRVVYLLKPFATPNDTAAVLNGWFESLKNLVKAAPRTDIAPNEEFFNKAFAPSAATLFSIGIVTYGDAFPDNHYETEFCRYHSGTGRTAWLFCDTHNVIR